MRNALMQDVSMIYSQPPNTGLSGIQMVIFWTQFVSGFQMVVKTTSLDRFIINKIFI
jgi:hypothetical protein